MRGIDRSPTTQSPRRPRVWLASIAFLVALLAPASLRAENMSILDPAGPQAQTVKDLFGLVVAITGVIFLLVEGALFYCIFRYRRRDPSDVAEPPQIYGSKPIEVAWTVAPALTVFVLFLVVVRTVYELRADAPTKNALHVTVVGHQWWWEYRYPELGVVTANELHVPIGADGKPRPIVFDLQSADVVHSFWIPRLSGKTDVIPNHVNQLWFEVPEAGDYLGQCAEYCGAQHANMLIRVVAEPPEAFEAWAKAQAEPAVLDPAGDAGRRLFFRYPCANCHTIRGTDAKGTFGPDLTHLMSRSTIASGSISNERAKLVAWVDDPQKLKPGCYMNSQHLPISDVETIVSFLETLR